MAAVKLIAIAGFVVLITLLEQTKPMEARRVKVVHIGPRVRKLIKKVDELKKELASREQCEPCDSIKKEGFLFRNQTADYIDAGKLSGPLDSFTFSIWVKLETDRYNGCIFSTGLKKPMDMDVGLYIEQDYLYFVTSGPDMDIDLAREGFRFHKWNHFCITGNPHEWKFYLNGKLVKAIAHQELVALDPGQDNLVFGQFYWREDESFHAYFFSFVGKMAGINFWDREMSGQDISELFKSCTAGKGNIISMADLQGMGEVKKISVSCKSE